ncbi:MULTISPECIES: N-carbamoyl-D-amino-acid hydrolase [Enterobacterales]|uniref:N-carbamoyl-D-amino-acid hydrolase n=1 Tax=Enterobacterales TaxID=91347 RepID=UPI001156EBB5|nr:N-carbamoyl-D-amino-acid hydrolase [Klebsiella sp. 2680]
MPRYINVAIGQLGPVNREDSRTSVINRMMKMMREAKALAADIIVYPELALTTFFPRWYMEKEDIDQWFEKEMPSKETQPLFSLAKELSIGFYLGYAEKETKDGCAHYYNSAILVDKHAEIIGKYRKVHLPGHKEYEPWRRFQHLEKRYFEPGDRFPVWTAFDGVMGMALCNDRRWPETYRVMGLQGVEMVFIGYNTPVHNAPAPLHDDLSLFHNQLSLQAGAYHNGCWVVGVAKAGCEENIEQIGGSCIVAPSGEVVAACITKGDEVVVAHCDLDFCQIYKRTTFNFDLHRQPHAYKEIIQYKGETLNADGSLRS